MIGKKKSFATITAPLQKMKEDLVTYIGEQQARIKTLTKTKEAINQQIDTSNTEIDQSGTTIKQLEKLVPAAPKKSMRFPKK